MPPSRRISCAHLTASTGTAIHSDRTWHGMLVARAHDKRIKTLRAGATVPPQPLRRPFRWQSLTRLPHQTPAGPVRTSPGTGRRPSCVPAHFRPSSTVLLCRLSSALQHCRLPRTCRKRTTTSTTSDTQPVAVHTLSLYGTCVLPSASQRQQPPYLPGDQGRGGGSYP